MTRACSTGWGISARALKSHSPQNPTMWLVVQGMYLTIYGCILVYMGNLITVMAVATRDGDNETLGNAIKAGMAAAGVESCCLIALPTMTVEQRAALVTLMGEQAVAILELDVEWRCVGCGSSEGRYDNGEACDTCVMASFADG